MNRIYIPTEKPMKVAFMFSGGATGLKTTMEDNPDEGGLYNVTFCLTDKPDCKGAGLARDYKIPTESLEYSPYINEYTNKAERREAYFSRVDEIMEDADPDVIVTSGFMLLATDPFVKNWYGKIMNGHPAKTYILTTSEGRKADGVNLDTDSAVKYMNRGWKRRYTGDNAVFDAIMDGQSDVATAVFFMDHGEDTGPNIVHSPGIEIDRGRVTSLLVRGDQDSVEKIRKYAQDEIQERLKYEGDGPAIRKALELAATGRLGLSDEVIGPDGLPYLVTCDGRPLPFKGYQM